VKAAGPRPPHGNNSASGQQPQGQHNATGKSQQSQPGKAQATGGQQGKRPPASLGRALFAEALGTFALTLAGAGSPMVMHLNTHALSFTAALIAPGLMVMVMIYTLGGVSGAHLNPAVSLAFAIRRDFPWRKVPGYILVQFVGAIVAALVLHGLLGNREHLGATLPDPHYALAVTFIYEALMTLLLVLVILGTAEQSRLLGPNTALAVGATIALCGFIGGPVTGASMNPARSFGPALVSLNLATYWIYLLAPVVGSILAVGCAWLLHGPPHAAERKAAEGNS